MLRFQLSRRASTRALTLLLAASSVASAAQPAPATRASTSASGASTSAASPASDIVLLSPFEVNTDRDTGYQAASSLAGGRIDTALDRTPAALSILTREFLDDIAASNFLDAALWSPNSGAVPANPESNDTRIDFRSTNTGSTPTVNYFNFSQPMDAFSTERIEFARGPNSILFGRGNLSGIATVNLKQPRFRNFAQLQLRFDDFETRRASLDVNRQLANNRAAVRLGVLHQDGQRWRKANPDDRRGYYLAAVVKLTERTAVRLEAEYGERTQTYSEGIFMDNASSWTGAAYTGNGTQPVPPNQGLQAFPPNADFLVFDPARPERGVLNYRGFARTQGAQNFALVPGGRPYIPNFPHLPYYGYDFQPPNNLLESDYYFATLYLEHQFAEDTFVQLAVNERRTDRERHGANWTTTLRRDPNARLPDGRPNPDFGRFYVDGEPTYQRQTDNPRDYRLLATHRLAFAGTEHRLSGFASWQRGGGRTYNERLVRADNPVNPSPASGSNFIQQRYYLLDAAAPAPAPFVFDPAAIPGMSVRRYRFSDSENRSENTTLQLAGVSTYFRGKLNTIVGYRRDDSDRTGFDREPDPRTGDLVLLRDDSSENIGTTSAGAVWYPLRQLGAFFNYSQSFASVPNGEPLLNSKRQPDVPRGQTREYGLYFKLLRDRVQGSLRYYDSFQSGRIVNAPGVPNINAIWQALGETQNVEVGALRDTQSLASTGWEFETTANLTRDWRTLFNLAFPRSVQSNSFPETIAYRARFLSQWQAAAPGNQTIANALTALDTAILTGADGREQNTQFAYRANVYSSYDFRTGPFRGFGLGAGANLFGRQLIGNVQNQPFNYLYNSGYTLVSAHLAYTATWRDVRCKFQLNVSNLFDEHIVRFSNVARFNPPPPPPGTPATGALPGDYPASFRYLDPRKFTLTTTFEF